MVLLSSGKISTTINLASFGELFDISYIQVNTSFSDDISPLDFPVISSSLLLLFLTTLLVELLMSQKYAPVATFC